MCYETISVIRYGSQVEANSYYKYENPTYKFYLVHFQQHLQRKGFGKLLPFRSRKRMLCETIKVIQCRSRWKLVNIFNLSPKTLDIFTLITIKVQVTIANEVLPCICGTVASDTMSA